MAGPSAPAAAGLVIAGKYRLTRLIGQGAMGHVWAAINEGTGREVAVKLIAGPEPELKIRLLREARACGQLKHRNIIEVLDVVESVEGDPVLVMPLLTGETLAERLTRKRRLDAPEAIRIARDVARALAAAHAQMIIHRDLKPANIFLHFEEEGADFIVKVLDFGVAKNYGHSDGHRTVVGGQVGSPFYMSPEQAMSREADPRADIWSLGVVMFEMLTGVRPFQGDAQEVIQKILTADVPLISRLLMRADPQLVSLVARCMSRDLTRRIATAIDFVSQLPRAAGDSGGAVQALSTGSFAATSPSMPASAPSHPQRAEAAGDDPDGVTQQFQPSHLPMQSTFAQAARVPTAEPSRPQIEPPRFATGSYGRPPTGSYAEVAPQPVITEQLAPPAAPSAATATAPIPGRASAPMPFSARGTLMMLSAPPPPPSLPAAGQNLTPAQAAWLGSPAAPPPAAPPPPDAAASSAAHVVPSHVAPPMQTGRNPIASLSPASSSSGAALSQRASVGADGRKSKGGWILLGAVVFALLCVTSALYAGLYGRGSAAVPEADPAIVVAPMEEPLLVPTASAGVDDEEAVPPVPDVMVDAGAGPADAGSVDVGSGNASADAAVVPLPTTSAVPPVPSTYIPPSPFPSSPGPKPSSNPTEDGVPQCPAKPRSEGDCKPCKWISLRLCLEKVAKLPPF